MDQTLKAKWVEALRSGKYRQGKGRLRDDEDRMCCLGVCADIFAPSGWRRLRAESRWFSYSDGDALRYCRLPDSTREALGLTGEQENGLIDRNDGTGGFTGNPQTFEQIADYIEQNL